MSSLQHILSARNEDFIYLQWSEVLQCRYRYDRSQLPVTNYICLHHRDPVPQPQFPWTIHWMELPCILHHHNQASYRRLLVQRTIPRPSPQRNCIWNQSCIWNQWHPLACTLAATTKSQHPLILKPWVPAGISGCQLPPTGLILILAPTNIYYTGSEMRPVGQRWPSLIPAGTRGWKISGCWLVWTNGCC